MLFIYFQFCYSIPLKFPLMGRAFTSAAHGDELADPTQHLWQKNKVLAVFFFSGTVCLENWL